MSDDDYVGADEIYIEGDDDEVGARARRRRSAEGKNAPRKTALLGATSITNGTSGTVNVALNRPFKAIGMRIAGANTDKLFFTGATIRGIPQDAATGSIGCDVFKPGETFFWDWDTANPGESFTLGFTNTHTAALTVTGWLIGYAA